MSTAYRSKSRTNATDLPSGLNLGHCSRPGLVGQADGRRRVERRVVEVLAVLEQEASVGGIHVERHRAGDRLGGFGVDRGNARQALGECLGIDERLRTAGRGVDFQEPAVADLQPVFAVEPLLTAEKAAEAAAAAAHAARPDRT